MFCFILNTIIFFCNFRGIILEVPGERMYVKVHKFKIRGTSCKCYMPFHCGLCTHEVAISIDVLRYVLTVFAIGKCVISNVKQIQVQWHCLDWWIFFFLSNNYWEVVSPISQVFCRIYFLENLVSFPGKYMQWSQFFIRVARPASFPKK